jgi:hypothetical protein
MNADSWQDFDPVEQMVLLHDKMLGVSRAFFLCLRWCVFFSGAQVLRLGTCCMTDKMKLGLVDLNHLLPIPVLFWLGHPRTICGAHARVICAVLISLIGAVM